MTMPNTHKKNSITVFQNPAQHSWVTRLV
jgi:hypothetical protein